MQKLIMAVKADVEGGSALAEALAKHPIYFDDLFVNLVEAGEQAGALETLLEKVATYKEKTEAIKKKVKKALTYPAAVLVVAFVVTIILLVFVIPAFEDLFKGFGADLPAFTRLVIDISLFVREQGLDSGRFSWRDSLRISLLQEALETDATISGSTDAEDADHRTDHAESGNCPLRTERCQRCFQQAYRWLKHLESVAGATGNIVYEVGVLTMRDEVATGQRLQQAMENTDLFPNMVIQMIAVGEESGSLDDMSAKVADFYEEDVDNAVDNLSSLLEPMIMAILGILVGGLVVAMYLPIFKMGSVI